MDASGLEIWGGVECTVARIGDTYFDQTVRSGHHGRIEDLDKIASLGITHLRYPVLWERVAPEGLSRADWSWTDERLNRLYDLGITPIVTLLHHGSGPRDTHLLDPEFPARFAQFAAAVARRYPWLRYFTPINEPATTARFSGLYGWWYPHRADETSFFRALFNQLDATRRAVEAIREHTPAARFVATEDLGKTYSTPLLRYQAEYENARRLLSYDLLCGTLERNEAMRARLLHLGFPVNQHFERAFFCPPNVLGFNYYVTGERWLDERLDRYPEALHGSNGTHQYADVEAVRTCVESIAGAGDLLWECWQRYGRTMAITEAHIACTREEQVRWLRDLHVDILAQRAKGADIRAMTVWSLLGAFDWNSALTRQDGYYESGAFDVSSGTARETAIASYVRCLTGKQLRENPAIEGSGWWRLPGRLVYPSTARCTLPLTPAALDPTHGNRRPIVIFGERDPLSDNLREACRVRNLEFRVAPELPLEASAIAAYLHETDAWCVFDCTGADSVWRPKAGASECRRLLRHFGSIAHACRIAGVRLAAISTPLVFAGDKPVYFEDDERRPNTERGMLYEEIEELLSIVSPQSLIIRSGVPFGGASRKAWHETALRRILAGGSARLSSDFTSAIHRDDLVRLALDLLIDGERGIVHAANTGETSALEILTVAMRRWNKRARIGRLPSSGTPRRFVLSTSRVAALRSKDAALTDWTSAA